MRRTKHTHDVNVHVERTSSLKAAQKQWELQHNTGVRNSPHADGTVSELADRLGISKSEVRRLKREGLIEQAIEEHNADT